jgi:hypothetical protein
LTEGDCLVIWPCDLARLKNFKLSKIIPFALRCLIMIDRPKIQINRTGVIGRLRALGLAVLPVAPQQDAAKYPATSRDGAILRDAAGRPKPAFTGKNPSFLDADGVPKLISHRCYQTRLPHDWELQRWFANPANGVMTMGGWQNIIWIDIDVKRYSSQARCDRSVQQWLGRFPVLHETWTERTHSGGWRFAIQVAEMPDFTNFGFRRRQHIGEILGPGRLTVLAPTIGPSGQPYVCLNPVRPIQVNHVGELGLKSARAPTKPIPFQVMPAIAGAGEVCLYELVSQNVRQIIQGTSTYPDRSLAVTVVAKELYGWVNWTMTQGLRLSDQPEALIQQTAMGLGIDAARVQRILAGIMPEHCAPAMLRAGGDVAAWRRIKRLNWNLYRVACPEDIQRAIRVHDRGSSP